MIKLCLDRAHIAIIFLAILIASSAPPAAHAQSADQAAELAARLNRERVMRGLAPLALNAKLTAAAQGHASDIARTKNFGHVGSDGSTVTERVARAGYGKYSWGYRLGENWAHYHNTADALAMWMGSAPHRNNILHQLLREMGIGVAAVGNGTFVYVINFGAQPNVLPIFINEGAAETQSPDVKITLTSEDVMPNGDGDSIGRPVQVMISNAADFAGALWQPYAPKITWTLAPNGGTKTVYVKYRDAKGRTALARNSIVVAAPTLPTSTPTRATLTNAPTRVAALPTLAATRAPTTSPTETLLPTMTVAPTETPTAVFEVAIRATETPTGAVAIRATETRVPVTDTRAASFDGVGIAVLAVMSIVLIRVWYAVER